MFCTSLQALERSQKQTSIMSSPQTGWRLYEIFKTTGSRTLSWQCNASTLLSELSSSSPLSAPTECSAVPLHLRCSVVYSPSAQRHQAVQVTGGSTCLASMVNQLLMVLWNQVHTLRIKVDRKSVV